MLYPFPYLYARITPRLGDLPCVCAFGWPPWP